MGLFSNKPRCVQNAPSTRTPLTHRTYLMSFAFSYNPDQEPPFVIYLAHEDKTQGSWRPRAMLGLTHALRTSGFLSAIEPEELHSLLVLLSFLAPDGRLMAFTLSLAQPLGTSPAKARARFEHLCEVRWLGQPIVFATQSGDGLDGFAPVPGFIPLVEEPPHDENGPVIRVVPREAVIAHSRRTYARTRGEVEAQIESMMNWKKPQPSPPLQQGTLPQRTTPPAITPPSIPPEQAELHSQLLEVGLLPEQADDLMKRYDALRIRRQLAWLPRRRAKNAAGYLLAAVKDDYAAPRAVRDWLQDPVKPDDAG